MSIKKITFILFLALIFTACKKDPIPCMEIDNENPAVGVPVTINMNCSKKTISHEFFMEGPVGAPENSMGWSEHQFTHTFTIPGTYTVILNAYNDFSFLGDMESTTRTITVN